MTQSGADRDAAAGAGAGAATEALVRSYLAAFATGDPDAVAAHVAEGFVNDHTAALGTGCVGVEEYRRRLPGFLAGFPGLHYEVESVVVSADGRHAAAAYRMTATSEGLPIDLRGAMHFDVDPVAGKILRRTDYWDSLVYLRQVGQAPTG